MKFLTSLLGKDSQETKTWDIKPAGERPASGNSRPLPVANTGETAAPEHAQAKKYTDPFLDDPMLDTMSLEADLGSEADNPYSTHSWANDPESETRKLKAIQIGTDTDKPTSDDFDPYDTGKMRRNWKR